MVILAGFLIVGGLLLITAGVAAWCYIRQARVEQQTDYLPERSPVLDMSNQEIEQRLRDMVAANGLPWSYVGRYRQFRAGPLRSHDVEQDGSL